METETTILTELQQLSSEWVKTQYEEFKRGLCNKTIEVPFDKYEQLLNLVDDLNKDNTTLRAEVFNLTQTTVKETNLIKPSAGIKEKSRSWPGSSVYQQVNKWAARVRWYDKDGKQQSWQKAYDTKEEARLAVEDKRIEVSQDTSNIVSTKTDHILTNPISSNSNDFTDNITIIGDLKSAVKAVNDGLALKFACEQYGTNLDQLKDVIASKLIDIKRVPVTKLKTSNLFTKGNLPLRTGAPEVGYYLLTRAQNADNKTACEVAQIEIKSGGGIMRHYSAHIPIIQDLKVTERFAYLAKWFGVGQPSSKAHGVLRTALADALINHKYVINEVS